jgi:hypothetical protein
LNNNLLLFTTRSAVGIGVVASVVGGDEDKFVVVLLEEEEVELLLDAVVLVDIMFISGR